MNEKIPFTDEQLNWLKQNLTISVKSSSFSWDATKEYNVWLSIAGDEIFCDSFAVEVK